MGKRSLLGISSSLIVTKLTLPAYMENKMVWYKNLLQYKNCLGGVIVIVTTVLQAKNLRPRGSVSCDGHLSRLEAAQRV